MFYLKPNAHGSFWNLHIEINKKINISETNRPIELEFYTLFIFKIQQN